MSTTTCGLWNHLGTRHDGLAVTLTPPAGAMADGADCDRPMACPAGTVRATATVLDRHACRRRRRPRRFLSAGLPQAMRGRWAQGVGHCCPPLGLAGELVRRHPFTPLGDEDAPPPTRPTGFGSSRRDPRATRAMSSGPTLLRGGGTPEPTTPTTTSNVLDRALVGSLARGVPAASRTIPLSSGTPSWCGPTAGATHRCRGRHASLPTCGLLHDGIPHDQGVRDGHGPASEEAWIPAIETDGSFRDGAGVVETDRPDPLRRPEARPGRSSCVGSAPPRGPATFFARSRDSATLLHHQHGRSDIAALEAPSPGTRPGRGPDPELEGRAVSANAAALRADVASVAATRWPTSYAGALLAWSQMLCFDGASAKAETARPCATGSCTWPHDLARQVSGSPCGWTRPGHGPPISAKPSPGCGPPSRDETGQYARPERPRPAGRDTLEPKCTTPHAPSRPRCSPDDRSGHTHLLGDERHPQSGGSRTNDRG